MLYKRACRAVATRESAPLVVDVGGLLGDFTLAAAVAGCRVLCFEPQATFARLVRSSVALNGLDDSVLVLNAAVGEEHGRRLYLSVGDGSHSGVVSFGPRGTDNAGVHVPSYRLDATIPANERVLLLKVDVEGYDAAAVASASALLQAGRVLSLIFEYTPFWTGPGQGCWSETVTWLASVTPLGLGPARLYALHRTEDACYGPLAPSELARFHQVHTARHLQTDVFVTWEPGFDPECDGPWTDDVYA